MQRTRRTVHVSQPIREYITDIVRATRDDGAIQFGASPRASLGLMRAGQALAILRGRDFILPDDIKFLAVPVIAHRLILAENERLKGKSTSTLVKRLIEQVPVPAVTG